MKEANRERKNEIKYKVTLNEEQKEAKRPIRENQIVVVTGRAGCGKSLVSAVTALDFINKKECDKVYVTRATVEVGTSLGYLPGSIDDKFTRPSTRPTPGLIRSTTPFSSTQGFLQRSWRLIPLTWPTLRPRWSTTRPGKFRIK